jgi:hypothetical protein
VPLRARFPRAAPSGLALLVVAGAGGMVQRNALHDRAGDLVRELLETALERPIEGRPAPPPDTDVALVTLPRSWGGDSVSGAIVLTRTDLYAALVLLGKRRPHPAFALQAHHAEDYTAALTVLSEETFDVTVRFREERSFRAALARDFSADQSGRGLLLRGVVPKPAERSLVYHLELEAGFREDYGTLLLYSDGRFSRLEP